MGWAAVAFYSKPFAFGNVESDRDRCHESWKCRNFLDCVICHFTVSKENQTCGDFVPVGAAWFSVCDKFPVEKLCGACSPLRSRAGIAMPDPGTKDWSFPSGHASASFASAVVIYKSCHRGIGVPALILAFAISLSRLYVGVHYPSDVIVGMIIGTLIALILFWIFGEKKYKARARRHR